MLETQQRAPADLVKDAVKRMGSLSKLLCPIQRDLENLAVFLAEREKDDSVVQRKDYDAMKLDLEGLKKQVSELSSVHTTMKTKIDTLTTEKKDLQKQVHELEKECQESDRIRTRMERYMSKRDNLRAQKSGWEREKMTLGHRFLNWMLRNHSWMHDEKILENSSAKSDFESSDGFTVCPGNPSGVPRQFALPEPPSKQPDPDKDSGSKDPSTGKDPPSSSTPARATDSSKSGAKSTVKAPPPKSPNRHHPSPTAARKSLIQRILTNPSWTLGLVPDRRSELPTEPNPRVNQTRRGNPVLKAKVSDISKKRSGCESASDSTKRSRKDASPKKTPPSTLSIKDMLGSDTDEEALVQPGDTGKLIREIRDVYADVYRTKPWRRYLSATGSFLPNIPDSRPSHPRHAASVAKFNEALTDFWQQSAEDVWTRMFMTSAKTDTKAWERLVYRLTRLVAELYILINHSDFKEDLIRFLCHPHPAWPQIFKNPINLLMMGKQLSREVAVNYLMSQSTKFWPQHRPLLFSETRRRENQSQVVAKRIFESAPEVYGKFDKADLAGHVNITKEAIEFLCKVAADYVDEPGYAYKPDTMLPFVTVRPKSEPDTPEQWFGKRFYPHTSYFWDGVSDTSFWEVQPDVSRIEESGSDEDGADQGKEASGAESEYEETA
ncbi:hypothetical protein AC1031_012378 [Aphanomyces cochlioides]|nr:hypothetical protein AC1031_012378 [Aphanomyces cochlioides]